MPSRYVNITSATTTVCATNTGILDRITVNKLTASEAITVYDNASAASGTKIATITLPGTVTALAPFTLVYDCSFQNGLTVLTSDNADITVLLR